LGRLSWPPAALLPRSLYSPGSPDLDGQARDPAEVPGVPGGQGEAAADAGGGEPEVVGSNGGAFRRQVDRIIAVGQSRHYVAVNPAAFPVAEAEMLVIVKRKGWIDLNPFGGGAAGFTVKLRSRIRKLGFDSVN
jgi:hypothetical protein